MAALEPTSRPIPSVDAGGGSLVTARRLGWSLMMGFRPSRGLTKKQERDVTTVVVDSCNDGEAKGNSRRWQGLTM